MTSTMHIPTLALNRWLHDLFFRRDGSALHTPESDELFIGIWWLSVFFFVLLMFLMVYWAIKYRRKPGTVALTSASHNAPLEIAWTVIPLGILAVIFFKGFHGYMALVVPPAGGVLVDLQAQKWDWMVTYPGGEQSPDKFKLGDKDVPVFVMPAGVPVRMRMHSIDVIHSFWVPDFRGKFDIMPNRYTVYWFQAEQPKLEIDGRPNPMAGMGKLNDGTEYPYEDHWVFCAEYCGDSHSEMNAVIRVVPETHNGKAIYASIIDTWGTAGMTPVQLGQRVNATKCSSCHTTDGKVGTGPTWKNLFGHEVEFTDGTKYTAEQMSNDEFFANYIRESILEPQKKIVKGFGPLMSSFQGLIKEEEIAGVIAFAKSISDVGSAGGGAPAAPVETKPGDAKPADVKKEAPAAK